MKNLIILILLFLLIPIFKTKTSGQSAGLELSLSYDIIKAQNGKLELESEINKGTEFKTSFPI